LDIDTPCPAQGGKKCQTFLWERRALPASQHLNSSAASDVLIVDLNCRSKFRYAYYHMMLDCSIPIMPVLGLVQRQEKMAPASALLGIHARAFEKVTDKILRRATLYPFVHLDGSATGGVRYDGNLTLRAASMRTAFVHVDRTLYERCSPCFRHNAYQAFGIDDPVPGAAGTVLVLWRDPMPWRKNSPGRAVLDHDRLVAALATQLGRERVAVHFGNESAQETVRLFANARVVMGVHGAGLVNSVFCRVGTLVIEITTFAEEAGSASLKVWRANMPQVYVGLGVDFSLHLVGHHHLRPPIPANVTDWDHALKPSNLQLSREHIYLLVEEVRRWLINGTQP
jgi:hypothetical protein